MTASDIKFYQNFINDNTYILLRIGLKYQMGTDSHVHVNLAKFL
jgi:hypothetical protein